MTSKLDKFTMAYARIIKEMNENKTVKKTKRVIKEQVEGGFYEIEIGLVDACSVAKDEGYGTYEEAEAKIKEDIEFFSQWPNEAMKDFSSYGGHGYVWKFVVPASDLPKFMAYDPIGLDDGNIFIMSEDAITKNDIEGKSAEEIIGMIVDDCGFEKTDNEIIINDSGMDGHAIIREVDSADGVQGNDIERLYFTEDDENTLRTMFR